MSHVTDYFDLASHLGHLLSMKQLLCILYVLYATNGMKHRQESNIHRSDTTTAKAYDQQLKTQSDIADHWFEAFNVFAQLVALLVFALSESHLDQWQEPAAS